MNQDPRRFGGDWACVCGNTNGLEGFIPFDPTAPDSGASLGPSWSGERLCQRCGRVSEPDALKAHQCSGMPIPPSPIPLTRLEWDLVAQLEPVRQAHGLQEGEGGEELAQRAFGVLLNVQRDKLSWPEPVYLIFRKDPLDPPFEITLAGGKLLIEAKNLSSDLAA